MKILVISDSHKVVLDSQIEKIKKQGNFNLLIHCGDNFIDAEKFARLLNIDKILQVPGNCDNSSEEKIIIHTIEGKKFLITHGHLHGVKSGLDELILHAKEEKVDAAIFGHTHCAKNEVIDGILYFNPGSTVYSKCDEESFGIIEIVDNNINGSIIKFN